MKKGSIGDKLLKTTFRSSAIQKSWLAHVSVFGPILEPAFPEDYRTRIELTNVLNRLSRRDAKGGLELLRSIADACVTDADHAAWLFFMGLGYEAAGNTEEMLRYYKSSVAYGHRFYLPYLKLAKTIHGQGCFTEAEGYYLQAIGCFDEEPLGQSRTTLASAYTNLASCLTMMHRYDRAREALDQSRRLMPQLPVRPATEAILWAAMGDSGKTKEALNELALQFPAMVPQAEKMTGEILAGTHAHFARVELSRETMAEFWRWFTENRRTLREKLEASAHEEIGRTLQLPLKRVFPFMQRPLELTARKVGEDWELTFRDYYVVALEQGYGQLWDACPSFTRSGWIFRTAH